MKNFSDLCDACCVGNLELFASGLIQLTFGNLSVADRERRVFAIKPSGVPYQILTPDDMVVVDFDGNIVHGKFRPSSDTPTHRRLYLEFPCATSVVHTHSPRAVAFAQAGREVPLLGTTHADYFRGAIPVTRAMTPDEIAADYEWETGQVIAEAFAGRDPSETPAVLVRNHGPFTWGNSAGKAVENAIALELVAGMALQTLGLSPDILPPSDALQNKHFFRKHGSGAYYGQSNRK